MDRLNSSLRLYNNNLTRAVMLRTQRQRVTKLLLLFLFVLLFMVILLFFFSLCARLVSDDLAFGMQTQHTTAVPDRDYVPLKTLLADNDNGSPAANNSKEHPV
jgi:hypothetical protein